ncbi:MAG: CGGC domain-containing protein [Desulfobacula sp.]|uniref:CGGC domain-containing protein n=1 Tax=Desulfobacula sp. TaxID=2593537 RepID=UPI0025BDE2A4|nr:CGGC domain-containing protein [Desulfobacula sp.]MCD4720370.1 CGGC domain-containing protein [Desulfobacula sp.]
MTNIAIIRCEKNENQCPLTGCFTALAKTKQGFDKYDDCTLTGVFTCRCPGDKVAELAKILKSKGAHAIHFVTCSFAKKTDNGWDDSKGGFCDNFGKIAEQIHKETGLPCVLGTAHLPKGYTPKILD